ncbi:hypothetical protein MGYG_06113 [Nannizzia gypsea CBS 118893]|uniref:Uncharacterized protein n=1 Tax=Arthroderma gypseum (strain ATCC MYA-4604 / CBS 118893) TaxID=535722 RepID=E4V0I1_ARTGP|nr:hypothetical protein MGYG_06113 [Nannizzia gypsea CBS 118893]EFR03118.1 hypothetical protein MGYG_06113 [Nannizzia gypsea CBS 118893]
MHWLELTYVIGPLIIIGIPSLLAAGRICIFFLGPILKASFEAMGAQQAADVIRELNGNPIPHRAPRPQVQPSVEPSVKPSVQVKHKHILPLDDVAYDIGALKQRDILLRSAVLDAAARGRLKDIENFDDLGPKDWRLKLADSKKRLWACEQVYSQLLKDQPLHSRIPQYVKSWFLMEGETSIYTIKHGKGQCRDAQGCCSRGCGCCQKPRGMLPSGQLYYSHCTAFCPCCIRSRGIAMLPKECTLRGSDRLYSTLQIEVTAEPAITEYLANKTRGEKVNVRDGDC